jgi:iron only hydrogenase large subunit-like protein
LGLDDFAAFKEALSRKEEVIAIVAPSVNSVFPGLHHNFNGFLKALGVASTFEVSCGTEETVRTYIEHLSGGLANCILSKACPAVVSFCEMYRPELVPYLAPGDGPLMNIVRKIKKTSQSSEAKVAVISPCYAKRREFDESGLVDFNVTFRSLHGEILAKGIDLRDFEALEYQEDRSKPDSRLSSPGGLTRAMDDILPGICRNSRKIAGPEELYSFLGRLSGCIEAGRAPRLVEALNCRLGCDGGSGIPPLS